MIVVGAILVLIILINTFVSGQARRSQPQESFTPKKKTSREQVLRERLNKSARLLKAARQSDTPGIIMRYACEIPTDAKEFQAATAQVERAERLMDRVVGAAMRRALARTLQDSYYSDGKKVKCSVVEGKEPALRMSWILFGETTAWQADRFLDVNTQRRILAAGFHRLEWDNGYGEGSWLRLGNRAEAEAVQFRESRELCDAVRAGTRRADEINATVSDPQ
jgi:hypothetical protein